MGFTTSDFLAMQARLARAAESFGAPPKTVSGPESDIQSEILTALDALGHDCWYVWHRMDKRTTCKRGTPDIVGSYKGRPFAVEVKRLGKKVTPEQAGELMLAKLAGVSTGVATSVEEAMRIVCGD